MSSAAKGDEKLIVCGHGAPNSLADLTAAQFATKLGEWGLTNKRFGAIYLLSCNTGVQAQDNSITDNFARDLKLKLADGDATGIAIYAPRGFLRQMEDEYPYKDVMIKKVVGARTETPERNYTLKEGLLLVSRTESLSCSEAEAAFPNRRPHERGPPGSGVRICPSRVGVTIAVAPTRPFLRR